MSRDQSSLRSGKGLVYGDAPVPYSVLWSAENPPFIGSDPVAPSMPAVCNAAAPGEGRPIFGKPHMQRQRETIASGLCDICGKPLKGRTKVSLSHARPRIGAEGLCIMQVEPLLHKECAALALRYCPSLKRDIRDGTLNVRLVTRYRVQMAQLFGDATEEFTGSAAQARWGTPRSSFWHGAIWARNGCDDISAEGSLAISSNNR